MQGDERSNKALKSTYGSMLINEMHQALHTDTVPSIVTRRVKELNNLYKPMYFMLIFI